MRPMGWLGWLRGGSDELARYAERGRVAFPAEVAAILARREGRGLAAAAVVLDVDTGQVLARVQVPRLRPERL